MRKNTANKNSDSVFNSILDNANIEGIRVLRSRIQLVHNQIKVIGIVSNDREDGKTRTAHLLARSYAQIGKKVLIIDGNMRKMNSDEEVAFNKDVSLNQLLQGKGQTSDALVSLEQDDLLFFLPSSGSIENSTELLESPQLAALIEELKSEFDYIIIDTPAFNEGMDAILLARQCDGVIYLVSDNKTKASDLAHFKLILDEAEVGILGAVYVNS